MSNPHWFSSRTGFVGIAFVCIGVVILGDGILWLSTRTDLPVNMPISMVMGHVRTTSFKVNRNEWYTIDIEVQRAFPYETLNCLLGTAMAPHSTDLQECPDRPSVVKVTWVLSSNGQTVAHGSTNDYRNGSWSHEAISRGLGAFRAESGKPYTLDLDILEDGSVLSAGQPRLKVEVAPEGYDSEFGASVILFLSSIAFVLIGLILLLVSFFRKRGVRAAAVR